MPRITGVRQLPSKRCGCERCREMYPAPPRRPTKNCSGSWQARWYDAAGKPCSLTRKKRDDAVDAMNRAKAEISTGAWIDPARGKMKLAEWRTHWLETRASLEDATNARDGSHWKVHVEPRWGQTPLASISHMEVQKWVTGALEPRLESSSVSSVLNSLDMLMAAARRDKRIHFNPCDEIKVKPRRKKHASDDRPPTIEQVQAAVSFIKNPIYQQLPLVALETGMRWGELAGLLPDCVDLDEGLVHVKRVLEEVGGHKVLRDYPKSDAGMRTLPLTVAARALFVIQFRLQPLVDGKAVFRGAHGAELGRNTYRGRIWVPATIAAGIHRESRTASGRLEHWPTIHDVRHTWASRLEAGGVPESTRKELLGHERPSGDVTWRYTHGAADVRAMVLRALGDEPEMTAPEPVRRLRLVS